MKKQEHPSRSSSTPLTQGLDYYINAQGQWVFTERYHLRRGYCCKNGCKHCPYCDNHPTSNDQTT